MRTRAANAGSAETITLTTSSQADYEPSWSPDGLALVFTRGEGETADLFTILVPADRDDPVPKAVALTDNDEESIVDEDPAWSPVGGKIAFSRTLDGGKPDLWILDLATKEELQLTDTEEREEHDPAWSPDGEFIAYQANGVIRIIRIADKEVFRLDLEGRASHATWRE